MSLRSSTEEYEIATIPPARGFPLIRHADIQGWEGMDTGFRRYDGTFVPIRRPGHTCACIFAGEHRVQGCSRAPWRFAWDLPYLRLDDATSACL